jgi:hypothetical protein
MMLSPGYRGTMMLSPGYRGTQGLAPPTGLARAKEKPRRSGALRGDHIRFKYCP